MSSAVARVRIAVEWNASVVLEKVLTKPGVVTVGEGPTADLTVPGTPTTSEIVRLTGDEALLIMPPGWVGTLIAAGKPLNPNDLGREIRLGPADSARLQPAPRSRVVVVVEPVEAFVPARPSQRDWALVEAMLLALVVHCTFLMVTMQYAPPPAQDRPTRIEQRTAHFLLKRPEEAKKSELPADTAAPKEKTAPREATDTLPSAPKDARQAMEEKVRKRGVLRALSTGSVLERLFSGTTDTQLENALAQLEGDQVQASAGNDTGVGTTTRGVAGAPGGGGTGAIGSATYDEARLAGVGQAAGVAANIRNRGERRARAELTYGSSDVEGSLTQKQIETVIRAHAAGIKYCYESELVRFPKLDGKITVKWWIDEEGIVFKAAIDSSTVENANLEECVLRQVKRWQFPKPGGGTVLVRFPFIFKGAL